MKVPYRQGLLQYQTNFLIKSGTTVYLSTINKPVVFTVSYGNVEYLFTEPSNQDIFAAWLNVPQSIDSWLYWDINKNTAERTFGITTVEPFSSVSQIAVQPISPNSGEKWFDLSMQRLKQWTVDALHPSGYWTLVDIPVDQHWFDTSSKKMKVWDGMRWVEYIRVFAAKISFGAVIQPYPLASQASLVGNFTSGKILFDGYGKPLKKSDRTFFTSEDQWFVDGSNVQVNRLELDISDALANESIPEFHVVKLVDFGRVALADYEDTSDVALAITTDSGTYDEIVSISFQGLVTNPNWNWPEVNAALWVDTNGVLTTIDPHITNALRPKQVPIARVVSETSIMFMQGLGGVGPAGAAGVVEGDVAVATTTTLGISKLTVPPTDPDQPIVVETNDPRLADARSPLPHIHAATEVTTTDYGTLTQSNVQNNLHQLYDMKLNLSGGTMGGPLYLANDPVDPLEAVTKQYVDRMWMSSLPYDIAFFIADNPSTPLKRVGSFLATRTIYIPSAPPGSNGEILPGSLAYAATAPDAFTTFWISINGNINDPYFTPTILLNFNQNENKGYFEWYDPYAPVQNLNLVVGDRVDVFTSTVVNPTIEDIVLTLVGCATVSSCPQCTESYQFVLYATQFNDPYHPDYYTGADPLGVDSANSYGSIDPFVPNGVAGSGYGVIQLNTSGTDSIMATTLHFALTYNGSIVDENAFYSIEFVDAEGTTRIFYREDASNPIGNVLVGYSGSRQWSWDLGVGMHLFDNGNSYQITVNRTNSSCG